MSNLTVPEDVPGVPQLTAIYRKVETKEGIALLMQHIALPIVITEHEGIRRVNEPVTVGIPLPKGQVCNPAALALYNASDDRIPLQREVLARWSDGSVQWALLDFLVNATPKTTVVYTLKGCAESVPAIQDGLMQVQESPASMMIDTGYAFFSLNPTVFSPFERISIQGQHILDEPGSRIVLLDEEGRAYQPYVRSHTIEAIGPLRTTQVPNGRAGQLCSA